MSDSHEIAVTRVRSDHFSLVTRRNVRTACHQVIANFVVLNMMIAIILEEFQKAQKREEYRLKSEHTEAFVVRLAAAFELNLNRNSNRWDTT